MSNPGQPSQDMELARSVAIWRDRSRCFPYIKGRVALYAILRTLGIGPGDEILIPGFTCVVVPAAVAYTGATPVYYDIDPKTLQGDPLAAERLITPRTRAILVQHNFGMMAPLGNLLERTRAGDIALIEDCAHTMGADLAGQPAGTLGTAAFGSLQWSKPTTTGLGGIARFNRDADLERADEVFRTEFGEPSHAKSIYLGILSLLFRNLYRPSWYWTAQSIYRWIGSRGIIQASSSNEELQSATRPADYNERFGQLRASSLDAALSGLPAVLSHRRQVWLQYAAQLAHHATWIPSAEAAVGGVALRFPMLVENREALLKRARKEHIELGDWFNAPLHPEVARSDVFGFSPELCPHGVAAAARVINLPTHRRVDPATVARVIGFLDEHAVFTARDHWQSGQVGRAQTAPGNASAG